MLHKSDGLSKIAFVVQTANSVVVQIRPVFADYGIVMQTENSIVTQNRTGLLDCDMLDKTENLMLHKSDSTHPKDG